MGTALTGTLIENTYPDVVQLGNSGGGLTSSLAALCDGNGLASALQLATNKVNVAPLLQVGGVLVFPFVTPQQFGALCDGVHDDAQWFRAAAASGSPYVVVPGGTYIINSSWSPASGQHWIFLGATLTPNVPNVVMVAVSAKNYWAFTGRLTLLAGIAGSGPTENLMTIAGSHGYLVEGARFTLNYGYGVDISGSVGRDGAKFSNCIFDNANVAGVRIQAGAEYTQFVNCNWISNTVGIDLTAGNTTFVNCNITDSADTGVILRSGSNHGHGIFANCQFNHNTNYCVHAINVTLGFSFQGCSFYSSGTADNVFSIDGSEGIIIDGGLWDTPLTLTGGTLPGLNVMTNTFVQAPSANSPINDASSNLHSKMKIRNCWDINTGAIWANSTD